MQKNEGKEKKSPLAVLKELLVALFIASILSYLILTYLIINTHSPTGSMSPTLVAGYHAFANRLAYSGHPPERGDIVVFTLVGDKGTRYVKRIIGLPGETLEIHDGITYIDGTALDEPYLVDTVAGIWGPYLIPAGCYFLMGDNRNFSDDSRSWAQQFIFLEDIQGKVVFSYYPELKII